MSPVPGERQLPPRPPPIGPLSAYVLNALSESPHILDAPPDVWHSDSDDRHLALYCCYELHYRGFEGCDPEWEWEPTLLEFRRSLERVFTKELQGVVPSGPMEPDMVEAALWQLASPDPAPSLSRFVLRRASLEQFQEFVVHRSAYQLKEADPHSWALPRLSGGAKAALVEIQADEYGGGREHLMHATLFAQTMRALGLDANYGAYLSRLPGVTLATVNLMSLFGLHRRWRGALVGHLALFEMTSTQPSRHYGLALRRLGFGREATRFFDEHVLADSAHEAVAVHDLAGRLAADEPVLAGDILFGARALDLLERRWSTHVLRAWSLGRSSLRVGIAGEVGG